jgi:hypothetical protein
LLFARPAGQLAPLPLGYHIHGGGMVMADRRLGVADVLPWAKEFGFQVISAEYRLAPEHPLCRRYRRRTRWHRVGSRERRRDQRLLLPAPHNTDTSIE